MISYYIADEAIQFITSESARCIPNETGGIVIGKFELGTVIVQHAIGPGPMATHAPTRFKRDGVYSQAELDKIVGSSGGEFDYIGEWHSHPQTSPPSLTDVASINWIAMNPVYALNTPILLICCKSTNSWLLHCYILNNHQLRCLSQKRK